MPSDKQYSPARILKFIHEKKEGFWLRERERQALALFHEAAGRVPAYKDFLKRNKVSSGKVKTWQDFSLVPVTSKKEYLLQYPLEELCWDGTLAKPLVFCATSGSTGEPFYFPRQEKLEFENSIMWELVLKSGEEKGPVLLINCFGMGVWIGGLITFKSFDMAARRGNYPASIINPGVNKPEIFNALRKLAPKFKQVIIGAYPPFMKDIIDNAVSEGIDLAELNLRLVTAAEPFTEKFREYLAIKADLKNICLDTLNIYGTADIGTMSYELPAAILIRRLAVKNEGLFSNLFSNASKTPTLANYNPFFVTFEAPDGEILVTGDSAVPLIRYSIGDNGGVLTMGEILTITRECGIDLWKEAEEKGIEKHLYNLPFVYVYERSDSSVKLYGAAIYPEFIKEALLEDSLCRYVTGKCTMQVRFDENQDQYLGIEIELKPGVERLEHLETKVRESIVASLLLRSSEYRCSYGAFREKVIPRITFWPYEHAEHFKQGGKQKWVKK